MNNETKEIWKDGTYYFINGDVLDLTGRLSVSNTGKVWSYHTKRILKTNTKANIDRVYKDYQILNLSYKKVRPKRFNLSFHRLILSTFVMPDDHTFDADHIDSNELNNNLDNLQWLCPIINRIRRSDKSKDK